MSIHTKHVLIVGPFPQPFPLSRMLFPQITTDPPSSPPSGLCSDTIFSIRPTLSFLFKIAYWSPLCTLGTNLSWFAWNFPGFNIASPTSWEPPHLICLTLLKLLTYLSIYPSTHSSSYTPHTHTHTFNWTFPYSRIEFYNSRIFALPLPPPHRSIQGPQNSAQ